MRASVALGLVSCVVLAACGGLLQRAPREPQAGVQTALADTPRPEARPASGAAAAPPPRMGTGRTAEAFDTTTAAERAAAVAPPAAPAAARELGRTVASLGDPAQGGFWMATPLVTAPVDGRVTHPASGASVKLELRPSGGVAGSGSQLSLAAFRALGLALTDLPELVVIQE